MVSSKAGKSRRMKDLGIQLKKGGGAAAEGPGFQAEYKKQITPTVSSRKSNDMLPVCIFDLLTKCNSF